jgi:hypothetical protein
MKAPRATRRVAAAAGAVALLVAIGGLGLIAGRGDVSATPGAATTGPTAFEPSASRIVVAMATISESASPPGSGFVPIDMFSTPAPPTPAPSRRSGPTYHSTDAPFHPSSARPIPTQSFDWLTLKAAGRVALVDGRTVVLGPTVDPLLMPATGQPVPAAHTLDLSWTRWIVEPPGYGTDEKGTRYTDTSFWNLCGPGSGAVTLYYWQQLTGHPDVTGTAGWFLDPYAAEGAPWPSPGPAVAASGGKPLGTYWSGSDSVSGFAAHGRGFVMYMAMQSQPPTWRATGISVWADDRGAPYYPTRGASLESIQTGVNWEVSGRDPSRWVDAWYGTVNSYDQTLARDLQVAVMLDVGRDGVPVVAAIDTFDLPNWQDGASTPHTRHAVTIVGYDNTASPPTFSYIDTCGRACNSRGDNQNGQIHVIAQSQMVAALDDAVGIGFSW